MIEILPFFLVIAAGLFISKVFSRLHLPWVAALIITGIIIGPFGLGWLQTDSTLDFLSQIGLIFLMFMAGLESNLSNFKEIKTGVEKIAILNSVIPFIAGLMIGRYFDYGWISSFMLGVVFVSSSIAVIIPSLSLNNLLETRLGKTITSTAIIEDISSLVLFSVLLQIISPTTNIPLPIFYLIIFSSFFILKWAIPKLQRKVIPKIFSIFNIKNNKDIFQQELRLAFTLLLGIVILFEIIGLHPVIAGFFAGLILSEAINHEKLLDKFRIMSYGIFIPIFFVVMGSKTNLTIINEIPGVISLTLALVFGSVFSKFISSVVGAKISGFSWEKSSIIGAATMPRLTTTLAVVFAGLEAGIFDEKLVTAMILLSLITTLISPVLINILIDNFVTKKITKTY